MTHKLWAFAANGGNEQDLLRQNLVRREGGVSQGLELMVGVESSSLFGKTSCKVNHRYPPFALVDRERECFIIIEVG